jgi:hypothetical protein
MSTEYAVFSDEGCLERQFATYEAAETEALGYRSSGDSPDAYAAEMCPDHADEEQPREGCEVCESEPSDCVVDDVEYPEHAWQPGDIECGRCGADLSEWNDDDSEEA